MSESGMQFRGRPNTQKDNANRSQLYLYCGGGGAGACPDVITPKYTILKYRVQKDIVFNRKLVLENSDFFGIVIGTDAGAGICSHNYGGDLRTYVGLGVSNSLDPESTAKASGLSLFGFGDLGTLLEFDAIDIPQPFLPNGGANPAWAAAIYVYLWWGVSGVINGGGDASHGGAIDERTFNIVKHDNDIRI